MLRAPRLGHGQARRQVVHGVHGARVVDLIRRDERGVERAGPRGVEELIEEVLLLRAPDEDAIDPEVLRARIAVDVRPLGILRILWRIARIHADVAEAARHADAIRLHQVGAVVIRRIGVIALRAPRLLGLFIERWIGEEPQAENTRGIAVQRSDGDVLAARADLDAGILRFVLVRIGSASGLAIVEPEAEAVGARPGRLLKARLIDQPEVGPAVDRKSTRLNSSHANISYAVFCLKKKKKKEKEMQKPTAQ